MNCIMIISAEQVRCAVEYLRTSDEYRPATSPATPEAPRELVVRVTEALREVPDVRDDRIAEARRLLATSAPTASEVAEKLIGRVISDAIR